MVACGDDKIRDCLSKIGVRTLEGHKSDVPFVVYRPMIPILVIGSEGGTIYVTA